MTDAVPRRLPGLLSGGLSALRPTLILFIIDSLANVIDYAFHVYLGRNLTPGDFAVFQAVNSMLLIAVTAFGVMQPVLARYVAEAQAAADAGRRLTGASKALFRVYFRWSAAVGLGLGLAVWLAAGPLGSLLNLPVYAVRLGATVVFLILLRPVVAGALQGAQRFIGFGSTRLAYAAGRFVFAALVLAAGAGLPAVVAALPVGQVLAVAAGLLFLGLDAWRGEIPGPAPGQVAGGLRLAGWAFLAYGAFTALQNLDLLWVNRLFPGEIAGAYAAAVLLRRILILFPSAAAVVMYPRIVAKVTQGQLPDRLLAWTIAFVIGTVLVPAAGFFTAGPWIVGVAFGPGYEAAGLVLGTMGIAMLGYGLVSIWLNLFLATRPRWFVWILVGTVLVQAVGLAAWHETLGQVAGVFAATGWLAAAAGALLYLFRLRPQLVGAGDAA